MFRFSVPFIFLTIAACAPQTGSNTSSKPTTSRYATNISENSCEARATKNCAFVNGPVRLASKEILLPGHKLPFYKTVEDLDFIDSESQNWGAPAETLTDGASIPPIFIRLIGAPTSREFINAATVHDAYCGSGNEERAYYHTASWPKVHRMFYDALRVGGTPKTKAQIMYAAVYMGGPRWANVAQVSKSINTPLISFSTKSFGASASKNLHQRGVPADIMVAELGRVKSYIQTNAPSIEALEHHLQTREIRIERTLIKWSSSTTTGADSGGSSAAENNNGNDNASSSGSGSPTSGP